ncbi:hydroxyacylglutathione hydrolase [Falsirhodobacter halotolerans]|uniref:hydroxyacylglutathione hydrolase n=1 Tax=Falsirhodobacter halotolerans TaxID=1146892 RepID=UPI001FD3ADF2|nr:hydroxyacylglutathione hydrolase [Falsirhodobacter halotolerans]MCJ8138721.1 hydroxyacylglutathione hydrolase [Falsirhodobacter halotolerans]
MPLELMTIPCLKDNYAFLVHNTDTRETIAVDVPEANPILVVLASREWPLTHILLTHHHGDHIDGVAKLRAATGAKVVGAKADVARLPELDIEVTEGDVLDLLGTPVRVIDVPGHTVGHIAFHLPEPELAFTGDSLMAGGCGRLFEGTPEQMWDSLTKLSALPPETRICSGHEYTLSNLRFALTLEPENEMLISRIAAVEAARDDNTPTVPSTLSEELATNPFLRANLPVVKAALGMVDDDDAAVFAEVRRRKDSF